MFLGKRRNTKIAFLVLAAALLFAVGGSNSALALTSTNVAIIDSPTVINGGTFPTSFIGISFTNVPVGSINATTLASYDTVLLNVASPGMGCTTNTLTSSQKLDLVDFVGNGGKLIIYDSECSAADYSWLPFPFTTNNPGAVGAQGNITFIEENTLSCSIPGCTVIGVDSYINTTDLASNTDAIGDMNVMTTRDSHWCLDIEGTNITPVTGPVHAYASYPPSTNTGLIIYNGMDVDYIDAGGAGDWLVKIWELELRQEWNPIPLNTDTPAPNDLVLPCSQIIACDPIALKEEAIDLKYEALDLLDAGDISGAGAALVEALDNEGQVIEQLQDTDCFSCNVPGVVSTAIRIINAAREAEFLAIRSLSQPRPNIVRAKYNIQRSIRLLKKADAVLNLCRVDGID